MDQKSTGFSDDTRAGNDNRNSQRQTTSTGSMPAQPKPATFRQRWNASQLSKTTVLWIALAMIVATMLVGFTWGGWVTGATAQSDASEMASEAVLQRLSMICVDNFQQDPANAEKLVELKEIRSYEQRDFVFDHGWATMPGGDERADKRVATECAKTLAKQE